MTNQANQKRIRDIYQMLFEMATGNFTFRILDNDPDDDLSKLTQVLNKIAEEMQSVIVTSGFIIPHYTYQNLVHSTFILASDFTIISFNTEAAKSLGYLPHFLLKIPFSEIVAEHSRELLIHIQKEALSDQNYHNTYQIIFRTSIRKLVPSFCTISKLLYTDKIIISAITTIADDHISFNKSTAQSKRHEDSKVIQELHDYILNHLDMPLPTLKELSKSFGTNEYTLKEGFKYFFNTSIYHFYNDERLKKAHLLIQQTDHPIKVIAIMCGFNEYTVFYKSFKKRFGYSPGELHRDDIIQGDE